jgi:flagellar motility protein MotE (MotC chaperone)
MIRFARDFRLIPIVLLATISLFALKVSGLVFDGGYTLAQRLENRDKPRLTVVSPDSVPVHTKIVVDENADFPDAKGSHQPWAQAMFNYNESSNGDVTGSVDKAAPAEQPKLKVSNKPPGPGKLEIASAAYKLEPGQIRSPGERTVLESLQKRREQLDTRSRELDMRENLLKAAEKRIEAKVAELKDVESRVKSEMNIRDKSEQKRFMDIIKMYQGMKPKDAARIFDHLDMKILIEVATQMNPNAMSAILAQMTPARAEQLTVELANHAGPQPKESSPNQLPKIESRPPTGG